jgi:hypothetical protein
MTTEVDSSHLIAAAKKISESRLSAYHPEVLNFFSTVVTEKRLFQKQNTYFKYASNTLEMPPPKKEGYFAKNCQ